MPITQDALTQDELDYLTYATLSEKVANKDEVIPLDRIDLPTYNWFMRKAKKSGDPVRGGWRINVKGTRDQKLTWWDGMDILPFEERYTGDAMRFYVGKAHFGDTMPFDFVERLGIRIDYNRGIKPGGRSPETLERVVNVLKENADDIKYNISLETAKSLFKSNVDQPKAFVGIDGLMPITNPTGGTIGGLSRSNPIFQHRVSTGWTADNILANIAEFVTLLQRRANGRKIDYIACGDYFYSLLVNVFMGAAGSGGMTGTVAGKWDYRAAQEKAMKKGEKYNIGLPQDCFAYQDILIVRDPIFEQLHREDSTAGWPSRAYFFCSDYIYILPVMNDIVVPHPMPYSQRVQFTSYHSELSLALVVPNSCGVATVSYTGNGILPS